MDAVEDIKNRLAIEDVVGRYVELKRAGRNFRGLSPFSSEKTPSFMVSPEKQIWHDFSSGKGGNMFSFVMEMEGMDFKAALELLARQAGVDLSQYRTGYDAERGKQKERLYEALELATKFYQVHSEKSDPVRISLKCDPQLAVLLREKYETVMAGYHLNKKHWNTVVLTGQLPWEEVQGLIRHSYDLVAGNKNAYPQFD